MNDSTDAAPPAPATAAGQPPVTPRGQTVAPQSVPPAVVAATVAATGVTADEVTHRATDEEATPAVHAGAWSQRASELLAASSPAALAQGRAAHVGAAIVSPHTVPPPRTPRGVQEPDVWAAADALLAAGQRPTIERVRHRLGRGSPNTVGPMLERWFATLGARLHMGSQTGATHAETHATAPGLSQIPAPVLEAAHGMWEAALQTAHEVAAARLAQQEASLHTLQTTLEAARADLEHREDALARQKQAVDDALQLAHAQRQDLAQQLAALQQQLHERDISLQHLRDEAAQARKAHEADRAQHTAALQSLQHAAAQERQRLSDQYAGNERRLLKELDSARQEADRQRKQHEEAIRTAQARYDSLYTAHTQAEEALLALQTEHTTTRRDLQLAHERVAELKTRLDQLTPALSPPISAGRTTSGNSPSLQRRALSQRALARPRKRP